MTNYCDFELCKFNLSALDVNNISCLQHWYQYRVLKSSVLALQNHKDVNVANIHNVSILKIKNMNTGGDLTP